jgi:hypothetical protein
MDKFSRAERIFQTQRLKNTRKNYFNVWDKNDPKQLGRIVQYPCMCSCYLCSRKQYGNSFNGQKATTQSFIQLSKTEV